MDFQINPKIIAGGRHPDASALVTAVQDRRLRAVDVLARAETAAAAPEARAVFVRRFLPSAQAQARSLDRARDAGLPMPSLAGLPVSVKDVFDVGGQPTTAASPTLAGAAPALNDAAAVARLRSAGAVFVGHTNMTEFAYSGVGLNPHYGTPTNAVTAMLNPTPRIPGGSTSGGAVSVACGAAWAALGTDTGGSLRIPAALHGLVAFKPTQRRVPRDGMLPLAASHDTAGAITLSVRDAVKLDAVLAGEAERGPLAPSRVRARPPRAWRVAVPQRWMLDGLDSDVARTFEHALARLREAGMQVDDVPLAALDEVGALQRGGGLVAAEAWAWHRRRLETDADEYDPRVRTRLERGRTISAADYIDLRDARAEWIAQMQSAFEGYDALLSPTVPMVAPPLAPLIDHDARFSAINQLLLRNPSVVNLLDGCALTLPCQAPGAWPVGLMLWAPAMHDATLLSLGLTVEAVLAMAFRGVRHAGSLHLSVDAAVRGDEAASPADGADDLRPREVEDASSHAPSSRMPAFGHRPADWGPATPPPGGTATRADDTGAPGPDAT